MADSQRIRTTCLGLLLRPIARFCLRRSIKMQDYLEVSKQVFVDVAKEELQRRQENESVSRLSVMTGIHRREIDRFLDSKNQPRYGHDLPSRVIGQWQSDKRFLSKSGKPRILGVEGKQSEFVELVASVSKNLNPYTVLSELERAQVVERTVNGLKLARRTYEAAAADVDQSFALLSEDSEDLIRAVEENVFDRNSKSNLHVKTQYDNISLEYLDTIRSWFLEKGRTLHDEARRFLSQFDRDINQDLPKSKGRARVAFGSFSLTETLTDTDTAHDEDDK